MLSRTADSLYWMSRYLERTEHTARLMVNQLDTLIDQPLVDTQASWRRVLRSLRISFHPDEEIRAEEQAKALLLDPEDENSLFSTVSVARENARQVRTELSSELWQHLNRQYLDLKSRRFREVWAGDSIGFCVNVQDGIQLLRGVGLSTMTHGVGWRFMQMGLYLERAQLMTRLLDAYFGALLAEGRAPRDAGWVYLLKMCNANEAFTRVHTATIRPDLIAEFLIFSEDFPRSIRYCVDRLHIELDLLCDGRGDRVTAVPQRMAGRLRARLDYAAADEVAGHNVTSFLNRVHDDCRDLHNAIVDAFIAYDIEARARL
ncbi:MAG: alpha-E domain-containing protein [Pseudomonadota bacterium]